VDPATAARLAPGDAQRIQRALEVWRRSPAGRCRAWHTRPRAGRHGLPLLALEPRSRAWLHQRIAERFDAMLAAGFVDEVQACARAATCMPDLPSMRCVGYRQAWERWTAATLSGLAERGIAATRQLAKRQLTWLRAWPSTPAAPLSVLAWWA
jgi:tRNA dimethylallyltransferase